MMRKQEDREVNLTADCGNSPKNILLKDFTIAFARGHAEFVLERVSDHLVWMDTGMQGQKGLDDLKAELIKKQTGRMVKMVLSHVLSHGKAGAVDGIFQLANGRQHVFCGIFEFASAKADRISRIKSYVVSVG